MDFGLTKKTTMVQEPSGYDNAKLYVWIKGLEGKVNNLLREVNILKNDFIKRSNKLTKDLKSTNSDFLEIKHNQEKMDQKMDLIVKELKQTAGIEEIMIIKKYMEFWNPLHFVTQQDLDRALENKIHLLNQPSMEKKEKNKKKEI